MNSWHWLSAVGVARASPAGDVALAAGIRSEHILAGDLFVVAHLGFFFLLLACFGWAAWGIWRRTTHPQPHMALLMEVGSGGNAEPVVEASASPGAGEGSVGPAEGSAWERSPDWWKW
jgi:hypothetical protein